MAEWYCAWRRVMLRVETWRTTTSKAVGSLDELQQGLRFRRTTLWERGRREKRERARAGRGRGLGVHFIGEGEGEGRRDGRPFKLSSKAFIKGGINGGGKGTDALKLHSRRGGETVGRAGRLLGVGRGRSYTRRGARASVGGWTGRWRASRYSAGSDPGGLGAALRGQVVRTPGACRRGPAVGSPGRAGSRGWQRAVGAWAWSAVGWGYWA
jgi:hypothetical protein